MKFWEGNAPYAEAREGGYPDENRFENVVCPHFYNPVRIQQLPECG
jgi:hypothetical protein